MDIYDNTLKVRMAVGTYVSIYKTDRNKLMEMFTFENITAGALLDSIFIMDMTIY